MSKEPSASLGSSSKSSFAAQQNTKQTAGGFKDGFPQISNKAKRHSQQSRWVLGMRNAASQRTEQPFLIQNALQTTWGSTEWQPNFLRTRSARPSSYLFPTMYAHLEFRVNQSHEEYDHIVTKVQETLGMLI